MIKPKRRSAKILIVHDEPLVADTLAAMLRKAGYHAKATYTWRVAAQTAIHFEPDMLISDVSMPGVDSVQAATKMKEILPHCEVLLFSGDSAIGYAKRESNFNFLDEPVHLRNLTNSARSFVPAEEKVAAG